MTEQEVIDWMDEFLTGEKPRRTTFGMIRADIMEYGFDGFLSLSPEIIIESYRQVADDITQEAVDDFRALFNQERELEELGLEQSFRLNPPDSMQAMRDGMADVLESIVLYVEVQRIANTLIQEDEE